jgi:DNA modification methylase
MEEPLRLEWWDPEELGENPRNWRRHPNAQKVAMREVLAEVGWAGAALYNKITGRLIDGHLRKKVVKKGQKIPVLVGSWTEEQEAKILLTLDPIAAMATADRGAIDELIASVKFESSTLNSILETLPGDASWQNIGFDELKDPADHLERADELKKKWKTAEGQLWEAGPHRVICGDSTNEAVVARLWRDPDQRFRMLWTDPPYGVNYAEKTLWMEKHGAQKKRKAIKNDSLTPNEIRKFFGSALRVAISHAEPGATIYSTVPSGSMLPFFIGGLEDGGFTFKQSLVWLKNSMVLGRSDYSYRHETLLYGWIENHAHYFVHDRTQDSVFEIRRPTVSNLHPTTKPVELIARMIANSSRPGELVYDPFCGSGSVLLSAHQLERVAYGVEIDSGYVAVSLERLAALGPKPKLVSK